MIESPVTRRHIVKIAVGSTIGLSAGCLNPDDTVGRTLSVGKVSVNQTDEKYSVSFRVSSVTRANGDYAIFNITGIVGRDSTGDIVCKNELETTVPQVQRLSIECDTKPKEIIIRTQESPCQDGTTIYKLELEQRDGEEKWVSKKRRCQKEK